MIVVCHLFVGFPRRFGTEVGGLGLKAWRFGHTFAFGSETGNYRISKLQS